MALKVHYIIATSDCVAYGYCNYEITEEMGEAIITEIPMDGNNNNLPRENLKFDNKDKKLKVK